MDIQLTWSNSNENSTVKVWRNETPFTRSTLPEAPQAVLENGEEEFIDTEIELDHTYYYLLETVNQYGYSLFSPMLTTSTRYTRGPGENVILEGNQDAGHMGQAPFTNYYPARVLEESGLRLVGTVSINQSTSAPKYISDNKIYYLMGSWNRSNFDYPDVTSLLDAVQNTRPVVVDGYRFRVVIPDVAQIGSLLLTGFNIYPSVPSVETFNKLFHDFGPVGSLSYGATIGFSTNHFYAVNPDSEGHEWLRTYDATLYTRDNVTVSQPTFLLPLFLELQEDQ